MREQRHTGTGTAGFVAPRVCLGRGTMATSREGVLAEAAQALPLDPAQLSSSPLRKRACRGDASPSPSRAASEPPLSLP